MVDDRNVENRHRRDAESQDVWLPIAAGFCFGRMGRYTTRSDEKTGNECTLLEHVEDDRQTSTASKHGTIHTT